MHDERTRSQFENIKWVLGNVVAEILKTSYDEAYIDSVDEKLLTDLSDACYNFKMRVERKEKGADKCL